jgi:hypothetical protein
VCRPLSYSTQNFACYQAPFLGPFPNAERYPRMSPLLIARFTSARIASPDLAVGCFE